MTTDATRAREAAPVIIVRQDRAARAWKSFKRFLRKQPLAAFGLFVLILGVLVAAVVIIYPGILPQDPYTTNILTALKSPDSSHPFGTDNLGRDTLSRTILATRFSLLLGLAATAFGLTITVSIGSISGYLGGRTDVIAQRLVDAFMGIPTIIFLLLVVTMAGASFWTIAGLIGWLAGVTSSRIIRSSVLSVKEEAYVEAARAVGASGVRVVLRHVLPNIMAPIIIIASLNLGGAILAESTLSFLGYGFPPPDPTWGQMMGSEARPYVTRAPWMVIFPGLFLSLAVFAINVFGDGLRDTLDPRLRQA